MTRRPFLRQHRRLHRIKFAPTGSASRYVWFLMYDAIKHLSKM